MIRVTLSEDHIWHGRLYLKGDRLIPEDLAIALNRSPVDPLSTEESPGVEPQPEPEKPKTRSRRKS